MHTIFYYNASPYVYIFQGSDDILIHSRANISSHNGLLCLPLVNSHNYILCKIFLKITSILTNMKFTIVTASNETPQ